MGLAESGPGTGHPRPSRMIDLLAFIAEARFRGASELVLPGQLDAQYSASPLMLSAQVLERELGESW